MKLFNKVAIIGVGLIGGSIGLAIKERGLSSQTIGVFRRRSTLRKALKCRAVDKATMSIEDGVQDADLIVLATPVFSIPKVARVLKKCAKKGAIVTDVGSTKKWIVDKCESILSRSSGIYFVGSHPMAGSEHAGVEYARKDLLEGSPCIVTRTGKTDGKAFLRVTRFWKALGGRVEVMTPSRHDRAVSLISHLPHIVAFGLAGAVPLTELRYAAEGFKDTTRVASSDPYLWADIFLTNRKDILRSARMFENYYKKIIKALSQDSYFATVKLLMDAKLKRDKLPNVSRS